MNKHKIFILILMISLVSNIALFSKISGMRNSRAMPADDPVAQWSATNSSTLVGPEAPLTVIWTGGASEIINNTLEISNGYAQVDFKGNFTVFDEPDHIIQIHIDLPGYYYCEMSWDDAITDLDAYIYSSPSLGGSDIVFKDSFDMATIDYPEKGFAAFDEGDYWIKIDWYDGNVPVYYKFFIGSSDYYYWNNTQQGSNQTINTGFLKDCSYKFTSTCFDTAGNNFTSSINLTTKNQFAPVIQWVKYNDYLISGKAITRGSDLVIEWLATDSNVNETIFTTMYYMKPGASTYSLLFNAWVSNRYTVNWQSSKFNKNGIYWFRIEVKNQPDPPSLPTFFYFYIVDEKTTTTSTTGETNTTGSSTSENTTITVNSSFLAAMIILIVIPIVFRQRKK